MLGKGMLQYSLGTLLTVVTICGVGWAIASVCGLVLGAYACLLVLAYMGGRLLTKRLRVGAAILAGTFAALPWFGLGDGALIYPGAKRALPTVPLEEFGCIGVLVSIPLKISYAVAELPFHFIAFFHHELDHVISFPGDGVMTVRPFVVFAFWGGIAIVLGAGAMAHSTRRKMKVA
jgi:hypothetical protein